MVTLVIGSDAVCSDGYRGEVLAVVIDPAARTVTHLAVEPKGRTGLARLVPFGLVDAARAPVRLRCTEAEFKDLGAAEETLAEFVPGYGAPVQLLPPGWHGRARWKSGAAIGCAPPTEMPGTCTRSVSTQIAAS